MAYWLLKTDAAAYTIDDLQKEPGKRTAWNGVRNYQARNFMREMAVGDACLFYHSGMAGKATVPTGIYGIVKVAAVAHPDESQFDPKDIHFEPRSLVKNPKTGKAEKKTVWECVDVKFVEKFKVPIPLSYIKRDPALEGMGVRQTGSRLSIQPVSAKHFERIVKLAHT